MRKDDMVILLKNLNKFFDVVRLVNTANAKQIYLNENGEPAEKAYKCYSLWAGNGRCANCVSAKAFTKKGRASKYEFDGDDVYYVTAAYTEMDGVPYVLETASKVNDEAILNVVGKKEFMDRINEYNKEIYIDPVTGIYNRRYYEEQVKGIFGDMSVIYIDIRRVMEMGVEENNALKAIASAIKECIRRSDIFLRFGETSFLGIFSDMDQANLPEKIENIRYSLENAKAESYEGYRFSASIESMTGRGTVEQLVKALRI